MKYARLSKEQFESLHLEFANFLAAQSIDKTEWDDIKANRPHLAEQELDVFSDLIWEGVLSKIEYLEQVSPSHLFLFKAQDDAIRAIILEVPNNINLETEKGINWLLQNLSSPQVHINTGRKPCVPCKNSVLFNLMQKGAQPSSGEWFNQLDAILPS